MTHYMAAFVSEDYISALELEEGREYTLTIERIEKARVAKLGEDGQPGDELRTRWEIYFKGAVKRLLLNRTNAERIAGMLGQDVDGWVGKGITVHRTDVMVAGRRTPAIRVVGSPDIDADMQIVEALPRKKPRNIMMRRTEQNVRSTEPKAKRRQKQMWAKDLERFADGCGTRSDLDAILKVHEIDLLDDEPDQLTLVTIKGELRAAAGGEA